MSSQYFPPYIVGNSRNVKVVLNLSGYAIKIDMDYLKRKDLAERNYLVYLPMNRYLTKITNTENISSWESMGIASDLIKSLKTTLAPQLLYPYSYAMQAYFKGGCLVNDNKSISDKKVLNIYIVYHLDNTSHNFHPKLKNCLFGSINVNKKHSDFSGRTLSGYGICFYTQIMFLNFHLALLLIMQLFLVHIIQNMTIK